MRSSFIRTGAVVALSAALATGCTATGGTGTGGTPSSAPAADDAKPSASASATPGGNPGGPPLPAALTGQRPDWRRCTAPEGGEAPGSAWRCATVKVPLDYAKPDGPTIPLALIRKEAGAKDARIGSLLFNFGGPGGSGVDILPRGAAEYTALGSRYDLVSFDPRGVQRSSGVVCRDDEEQAKAERTVDYTPETAAEEKTFRADAVSFGQGCERRSGTVLPYTTTSNTARDMDLIRQVLGDPKLHYFGISYGTQLGAAYAHLFPRNVGRMVLDAVVDPTADSVGHARNQTIGFQRALDNYLTSTGQDPEEGTRRIVRLLERLDKKPLAVGDRELNDSLALTGVVMPLYAQQSWPLLTSALTKAENGSGAELLSLADWYNDRDATGHYSTQSHAQRAISCADSSERPTLDQARALLPEFRRLSPVFGAFLAWDTAGWCADWPVEGESTATAASAPGAAPILVVGTTGDPATPYEGAERMAKALGPGVGVLVTNKGEGHGAYGSAACATKTIDAYLLQAEVPAYGTTCE